MKSLATCINQKQNPKFYGPFEVLERIDVVADRLKLPPGSAVHPDFHAYLLKKCVAPNVVSQPLPAGLIEEWELKVQPSEVLATRRNSQGELKVLIKWLDMTNF